MATTPFVDPQQKVRWGIVGTGTIATIFARDMPLSPETELVAVASRSQEKAEAFGELFAVPRRYGSYEELYADPEIDVVYVATPHPMHHEVTIALLKAGKHVLCEKPFAMNVAEAEEMIACAQETGRFLMEAYWTRFRPATVKWRELIRAGEIGEVQYMTATMGWRNAFDPEFRLYNKALGGSALLDAGCYAVQGVQMVLGEPDEIVSVATLGESGVDENCMITTHYPGGAVANAGITIRANSRNLAMIAGNKGSILVDHDWHRPSTFTIYRDGQEPEFFDGSHAGVGYQFEMDAVNACLKAGQTEHEWMPHADTLTIMRIMRKAIVDWGVTYPSDR